MLQENSRMSKPLIPLRSLGFRMTGCIPPDTEFRRLAEASLAASDLKGSDMPGADLCDVDMTGTNLGGCEDGNNMNDSQRRGEGNGQ